jgi:hypothetical protein
VVSITRNAANASRWAASLLAEKKGKINMIEKFKKATNEEAGDNWLICWTGSDDKGNGFNVTTDCVHASELHEYTRGAEGDADLIARLLNWYYFDPDAAEQCLHMDAGYALCNRPRQ